MTDVTENTKAHATLKSKEEVRLIGSLAPSKWLQSNYQ
jgi:hypothetical protein